MANLKAEKPKPIQKPLPNEQNLVGQIVPKYEPAKKIIIDEVKQ